jgi:hypothetical protein
MFFHTAREEQVEKIFGITTGFGVTLLNRSHPLPRLVEMEEKCHGALLANTTHGALYRALASISPEPNALARQVQFWVSEEDWVPDVKDFYDDIRYARDEVLRKA